MIGEESGIFRVIPISWSCLEKISEIRATDPDIDDVWIGLAQLEDVGAEVGGAERRLVEAEHSAAVLHQHVLHLVVGIDPPSV
jgi:hypothetical protein